MPAIVRANADAHSGHSGYRVPFHKTYYTGGSGNVFINGEPVILKGNKCLCGDPAVGASGSVFVNGVPVHRKGDATGGHGNWVPNSASTGSPNVFANGGPAPGGLAQTAAEYNPTPDPGATVNGADFTAGPAGVQGFKGTPDPTYFVLDANGDPFLPRANAVPGVDYTVVEFTPGIYTIVNLHDYTPDSTKIDPVEAGKGIARTYTIDGYTFETARFYTEAEYNPPLHQYGQLNREDRFALLSEYAKIYNIDFMTDGPAGPSNPAYYESDAFKAFLESKGLGDNTEGG
jgi:uncharacterized Zn-binding protein involved in type VI secretion